MSKKIKTLYVFPRTGSISIARKTYNRSKLAIGMLEFELGQEDRELFEQLRTLLRRSQIITVTHAPDFFHAGESSGSNILVAFHEDHHTGNGMEEPLMVMIQPVDIKKGPAVYRQFNDRTFNEGYFALSITMDKMYSSLFLNEVHAVAPPIKNNETGFQGIISIFVAEPRFFAEYSPPLSDPMDGISVALINSRSRSSSVYTSESVNLTGLIPEGRA